MPPDNKEKTYKFDLLFLKRFYRLQGVFFPALLSTNAGVFLGLLLLSGIGGCCVLLTRVSSPVG